MAISKRVLLLAAAWVLLAPPAPAGAAPAGVRLLPSGPSLIHFVVEVPEPGLVRALDAVEHPEGVRLQIAGYDVAAAPGEPELPVRTLLVAVPPRGEVRVRSAASGSRTQQALLLAARAPVEREPSRERGRIEVLEQITLPGAGAGPRARLIDVSWMRNQRVARVAVSPADYDPARRLLTTCSQLDVEITVEAVAAVETPAATSERFEEVYRDVLVNYEQGKKWRRASVESKPLAPTRLESIGAPAQGAGTGGGSVFVGRSWIKIPITQTGFYKVDFGQIRNLAPFSGRTDVVLDSLRLFTWPGMPVLDETNYCDGCDYREVAIGLTDDGDGVMDINADAFYFFALGPSDWTDLYDPARPDSVFINNPYETRSYCYLTISEAAKPVPGPFLRITPRTGAPTGGAVTPTWFTSRVHREVDTPSEFYPDLPPTGSTSYWDRENWFWKSLSTAGSFVVPIDTPGRHPTEPARLRARLWGRNVGDQCEDGAVEHLVDVDVNGAALGRHHWPGQLRYTVTAPVTNLQAGANAVRFTVPDPPECPGRDDRVLLGWVDLFYPRLFEPVNDELVFDTPSVSGDYRFDIGPFIRPAPPRVFDVTDPHRPSEIVSFLYQTGTGGRTLSFQIQQQGRRRFRVVRDSSIAMVATASISAARPTSLEDLHSPTRSADYLVIFYDDFAEAANALAAWRNQHDGFETMTVPISALYDQFSGGRTDPAAIRNFLRTVYITPWAKVPDFVTLLGDASNDFKNYLGLAAPGQPGSLLPSYEYNFDFLARQQYATDDWLLNVDDPRAIIPDFMGGRLPMNDAAAALALVRDKILFYESSAPFGEYRNRVMLIADDNEAGRLPDGLVWRHLGQTTKLDTLFTPPHIDREYVYLHTYPDPDELGSTKPEAKEAIINGITQKGVVALNYIGHGSPFQVADERVFVDTDVGSRLDNRDRLPVFIGASCDLGRFNDPLLGSLGEKLVLKVGGGAIAVISATGDVYSNQNAELNESLYVHIFKRDVVGRYNTPLAQALITAKSGSQNSQKYQLLGDAATRLNLPQYWAEVTLWDSSGHAPITGMVQGQTVLFRGQVRSHPDSTEVLSDFKGVAALLVEDAAPLDKAPDCRLIPPGPGCGRPCLFDQYLPTDCRPQYYFRPGPIYRGDIGVENGRFEGRFVVPMEARFGPRGRIRAYLSGARAATPHDGVGSRLLAIAAGTAPSADREGPRITLSFTGGATSVRPDATLKVLLFDASGILTTAHTLQNGIVVTVDDNSTNRRDITASFRYAADSYQSGTATYQLENLPAGPHRIRVSAADNLAAGLNAGVHRSSAAIEFEVSESPALRVTAAYLFPNPTRSGGPGGGGQFIIDAPGDSVNTLIRIYTVSGRLIRELRASGGEGQIQIPWDGRDAEGSGLANGTYVFRAHVNAREVDGSSSATQRDVVDGRFVILGP